MAHRKRGSLSCRVIFPLVLVVSVVVFIVGQSKSLIQFRSTLWKDKTELLSLSHENSQVEKPLKDGWHTIQVFYGDRSLVIPDIMNDRTWFSQANQDRIVASLFRNKREGYFIDLAANDPVKLSNTLALERKFDWKGRLLSRLQFSGSDIMTNKLSFLFIRSLYRSQPAVLAGS